MTENWSIQIFRNSKDELTINIDGIVDTEENRQDIAQLLAYSVKTYLNGQCIVTFGKAPKTGFLGLFK